MTPEQEYLKNKIEYLRHQTGKLSEEINNLVLSCKHHLCDLTMAEFADPWMSITPLCEICGTYLGAWRCKESPDKVCHYHTRIHPKLKVIGVELITGQWDLEFPEDRREDSYECVYCGMPEERK